MAAIIRTTIVGSDLHQSGKQAIWLETIISAPSVAAHRRKWLRTANLARRLAIDIRKLSKSFPNRLEEYSCLFPIQTQTDVSVATVSNGYQSYWQRLLLFTPFWSAIVKYNKLRMKIKHSVSKWRNDNNQFGLIKRLPVGLLEQRQFTILPNVFGTE